MTIISDLSDSNLSLIANKLIYYENIISQTEKHFQFDEKKLEELCKNHIYQLHKYDFALQELKSIYDLLELEKDKVKSRLWKKYNEKNNKLLSSKDIEIYIAGETEYTTILEILLEVNELRRKFESIVDAFKSMGWSLNNIVKIRVSSLEETVL